MESIDRWLHRRHEEFLEGGGPHVRGLVAASWNRSAAAGLRSDTAAPFAFRADELAAYRAEHALSAVFPMLYDVLGRAAVDSDCVMAVGDSDGRLLWVCGRPDVLRAADGIHFSEGAWWAERQVGTNALGTSLEVAAPVQIRSAEHFTLLVQPWSCAAAPIYDPETQRVLGVVDITGGADASSPQSLALVRAAARMAEAELGRLTILRKLAGDTGHRLRISALGRPDAEVRVDGHDLRLSRRHSDIIVLLAEHPEGLTAEELSDALYGEADHRSSLRGEVTRLRALLGADIVESRPYRLRRDVAADWLETADDLDSHLLSSAVRRYVGPVAAAVRRTRRGGLAEPPREPHPGRRTEDARHRSGRGVDPFVRRCQRPGRVGAPTDAALADVSLVGRGPIRGGSATGGLRAGAGGDRGLRQRLRSPRTQNTRIAISAGADNRPSISSSSLTKVTDAPAMSSDVQYSPT